MTTDSNRARREITLPAATFVELLGAARREGDDALREHGRAAGRALAERLLASHDDAAATRALPTSVFWKRVNELFGARGWGSLAHCADTPGVAELRSTDWIEAERGASGSTCAFTAGVIEGLLGAVSGTQLEVREAECRAAGATACRFQFGSRAALDAAATGRASASV